MPKRRHRGSSSECSEGDKPVGPAAPERVDLNEKQLTAVYGVGFSLLKKMGFSGGGLGASGEGIANPILVAVTSKGEGLDKIMKSPSKDLGPFIPEIDLSFGDEVEEAVDANLESLMEALAQVKFTLARRASSLNTELGKFSLTVDRDIGFLDAIETGMNALTSMNTLEGFASAVDTLRSQAAGSDLWYQVEAETLIHAKSVELLSERISATNLCGFIAWLAVAERLLVLEEDLCDAVIDAFSDAYDVSSAASLAEAFRIVSTKPQLMSAKEVVLARYVIPRIEREIHRLPDAELIGLGTFLAEIRQRNMLLYDLLARLKAFKLPEVLASWQAVLDEHSWREIVKHKCQDIHQTLRSLSFWDNLEALEGVLRWESVVGAPCLSLLVGNSVVPLLEKACSQDIPGDVYLPLLRIVIVLSRVCYVGQGFSGLCRLLEKLRSRDFRPAEELGAASKSIVGKHSREATLGDVLEEYCSCLGLDFAPVHGVVEQTRPVYDVDGEWVFWINDRLFRRGPDGTFEEISIDQLLV